jgi:hypothetical protein
MQQKDKTTSQQNEHWARQSTAPTKEKEMQNKEPEFYVEVSRPGPNSWRTATDLELPASQSVIKDALQKARVTDERVNYKFELLGCKRGYLRPHIKGNENLNALNELAKLLQKFDYNEAMKFQAMVSIESERNDGSFSLQQLSNLANSTCNYI